MLASRAWPLTGHGVTCNRVLPRYREQNLSIRIGYKASAEHFGPRELVEYAVRAEQVGLDSVMVSDHFLPWRLEGGHAPFALSWLAAVGERTERVRLGT